MENKNKKGRGRDAVFFLCTIPSLIALNAIWMEVKKVVSCPFVEKCRVDNAWEPALVVILVAAWYYYFQLCYWWMERKPIERNVIFRAAVFGGLSLVLTFPVGLMFTFPAAILAGYIIAVTENKPIDQEG